MNRQEYLLTCLAEECAEVQKLVSKSLRFGLQHKWADSGPGTNQRKICEEIGDICAIATMLEADGAPVRLTYAELVKHLKKKTAKVERNMKFSRKTGCLND